MSLKPEYVRCPACNQPHSDLEGHLKERSEYGDQGHQREYWKLQEKKNEPAPEAPIEQPVVETPKQPEVPQGNQEPEEKLGNDKRGGVISSGADQANDQ